MININYNKKMMWVRFLMLEIEVEWSQKFEYSKVSGKCLEFGYKRELRLGDREEQSLENQSGCK